MAIKTENCILFHRTPHKNHKSDVHNNILDLDTTTSEYPRNHVEKRIKEFHNLNKICIVAHFEILAQVEILSVC